MPDRRRTAVLVFATALALTGCTQQGTAGGQSLSVTYATEDGAEPTTAEVGVPELSCTELADSFYYETPEKPQAAGWKLLSGRATSSADAYILSVKLADDLWFVSSDAFTGTADGVEFDDVPGVVTRVDIADGEGSMGAAIDTAATITGTLACTD